MLGAQALRTKQKAERKEKEKRHRERLRSIEMQRNQMHRNACEDAAAQFMEITANPPLKVRSMSLCKSGDEMLIVTTKHRHSVHSGTVPHLQVRMTHRNSSSNGSTDRFEMEPNQTNRKRAHWYANYSSYNGHSHSWSAKQLADQYAMCLASPLELTGPQRSTSSDYCKVDKKNSISGTTRLLKWLGISDKQSSDQSEQVKQKPISKRRMSTFT